MNQKVFRLSGAVLQPVWSEERLAEPIFVFRVVCTGCTGAREPLGSASVVKDRSACLARFFSQFGLKNGLQSRSSFSASSTQAAQERVSPLAAIQQRKAFPLVWRGFSGVLV
jgi:hypothetical protein